MVLTTTARGQIIATAPGSVGTDPHAPVRTARSRVPPGTHEQAATAAGAPVGREADRDVPEADGPEAVPAPKATGHAGRVPTGARRHRADRNAAAARTAAGRRVRPAPAAGRTADRRARLAAARRSGAGRAAAVRSAGGGTDPTTAARSAPTVPARVRTGTARAGTTGPARAVTVGPAAPGATTVAGRASGAPAGGTTAVAPLAMHARAIGVPSEVHLAHGAA